MNAVIICALCTGIAFLLGMLFGFNQDWTMHRSYCDCEQCKRWRDGMAENSIKRNAGEKRK